MHFQLHPFPYVLQRLYRKDKYSFPPCQQGVHPLPEFREVPFFLYKVFKTSFSIYVYILKILSKLLFPLHAI